MQIRCQRAGMGGQHGANAFTTFRSGAEEPTVQARHQLASLIMSPQPDHRVGRFEFLQIQFGLPELEERIEIYRIYAKHLSDSELRKIAKNSAGFSGRSIKDVCSTAERKMLKEILGETPKSDDQAVDFRPPHLDLYIESIQEYGLKDPFSKKIKLGFVKSDRGDKN